MRDFVFQRVEKISSNENEIEFVNNHFKPFIEFYINDILIGTPDQLIQINDIANQHFHLNANDFKRVVEYVFNYKVFTCKSKNRYDAYDLAIDLDINTCPYCNRNYTNTVIKKGEKITRPQFDHYFDKGRNPLLSLSFFNLIPSCSICNSSAKGKAQFNLNEFLHPYIDNSISDIRFTYKYCIQTNTDLKVEVVTPNPSKAKNTVSAFAIEAVYNSHTSELLDLIKTRQYFSDRYLGILSSNLLKDVIISREDLYRIVFGTEFDTVNFVNRPLSKFKNDILKELGVITEQ